MRHFLVRLVILIDAMLALHPAWAWFLAWRWTGRMIHPVAFARGYFQAVRFVLEHARHGRQGGSVGAWSVDWFSPPLRRAAFRENVAWTPRGSCGTCRQCCSTTWLPEPDRVFCPFLTERGCGVYGGLFWDYFNCGRFPVDISWADSYACPRFGSTRRLPMAATQEES